ncbi:MAG: hypothetical protein ACI4SE_08225 [Lachnospiraceae bacterium]
MKKEFSKLLEGKKLPIAVLDHEWHEIFRFVKPDKEIRQLEEQLNELLKRQGKAVTESKEIRKLKSKLMDEIVQMMDEIGEGEPDAKTQKKLDENKRLINECNEKVDTYQDELLDLPKEIDVVNKALMIRTMELCYDDIASNTKDIREIAEWITKVRIELKKQVLRKQDREIRNQELYHYLHGIFGADVIDIFDMTYHPETAGKHEKTNKSGNQKQEAADRKEAETTKKKETET